MIPANKNMFPLSYENLISERFLKNIYFNKG